MIQKTMAFFDEKIKKQIWKIKIGKLNKKTELENRNNGFRYKKRNPL